MVTKPEKRICFIISPIGDNESEVRKRSDKVLKHIITPSVEPFGYDVIRADKISEPGIITTQIIQYIVDSALVVADLTDRNPNVFYELALRHAIRKPLVQMIKKGETVPFDVAATRIIHFDIQDLDSVDQAKTEIANQIKAIELGKNEADNPISVSLDLKMLKESANPEQRSLADVVEALADLRGVVTSIDKRINNPDGLISPEFFEKYINKMRKMGSPDFMMYSKELRFEMREITERLKSYMVNSKRPEKDVLEIQNIIERLEKLSMIIEDLNFRIGKGLY
jgi:hypothetical protein